MKMSEHSSEYLYVKEICERAKAASASLACTSTAKRNAVLLSFATALRSSVTEIVTANKIDLDSAAEKGVRASMLDRLKLDEARILGIAEAVSELIILADPIGSGTRSVRPNGLEITKIRVPLGVVGVIFEARPNVSADIVSLCVKSGNAAVLRGGSEAIATNNVIVSLMRGALKDNGLPADCVSLIENTDRACAAALMEMRGLVDVLIPRGGAGLIRSVVENAKVPVIETGAGNCHVYVHSDADLIMADEIIYNAKVSRPAVCNSIETVLIHSDVAAQFLPMMSKKLKSAGVEIRGCERVRAIIECDAAATEDDWKTEYDDLILAVKVVDSLDEAIAHINRYGTGHSDAIITKTLAPAVEFQTRVDSAAVYMNASTRFSDGGEFGFGAEVGISTQKLHVRGPMGLDALTTSKYLVNGSGQIR